MSQTRHPSFTLLRSSLLTKSLGILSGLGLLSSGLAWSQTDVLVDNLGSTAPPTATPAPAPAPAPPQLNKAPKPAVAPPAPAPAPPRPAAAAPAPQPVATPSKPLPAPTVSVPPRSTPNPSPSNASSPGNSPSSSPRPPVATQPNAGQTQTYIDQTQYGRQPAPGPSAAPSVVVRDRSQTCKTVVQNGRLTQGSCNNAAPTTPHTAQAKPSSARRRPAAPPRVAIPNALNQAPRPLARRRGVPPLTPAPQQKSGRTVQRVVPENFSLPKLVNRALKRPAPYPNNGNRGLLFPLGLPSEISSVFGWRIHPISGNWRMHNGTDLAAPQGTPVVAAYHGEVVMAETVGGYGNLVVLRHEDGHQESRYAHLEHIFVQPGEWVEQGEVIGLVGSTGHSTGPHLHFEWRHWVANSWIAVDAGPQLEWALAEMRQAMLRTLPPEQYSELAPESTEPEWGNIALGSGLLLLKPDVSEWEATKVNAPDATDSDAAVSTVEPVKSAPPTATAPKPLFKPQPLYRLERSNPDQPLKALPAKELQNPALQP